MVPYGSTFLIVGGRNGAGAGSEFYSNDILQFDPDEESWIVREERLARRRYSHYAAIVSGEDYECQ